MSAPEVWLRGALPGVTPLLQPVAHSLLQSREEVRSTLPPLTTTQLWARPGASPSIGFHVRHAAGSLRRLMTYARGELLGPEQLMALALEDDEDADADAPVRLAGAFELAVSEALAQVQGTPAESLLNPREVGRARLPSTVIGLLVHAAEHTQRHVGQVVTLARVVAGGAR